MKLHSPPYVLRELKLELTYLCGLKCVHCSSQADNRHCVSMAENKVVELIDEAFSLGVSQIAFSGGEPLLWNNLGDVIKRAKKYGMNSTIYTTGNVPTAREILHILAQKGLDRAIFSIFSADAAIHESITQVSGSFDKTIMAMQHCHLLGIATEIHFVPLSTNFMSLRDIAILSKKLGATAVSVLRLVPQGRATSIPEEQLSHAQNIELRKMILILREEGYHIRVGSPYNFLMLKDSPSCCSGIDRLTIRPDLTICPCDAFKQIFPKDIQVDNTFYSLAEYSLKDCWEKSPYLNVIRNYLQTPFAEECSACSFLEFCLSGCLGQKFHHYGHLAKKPDPMCLRQLES